jgi:hypothetical protein
MILAKVLWNFDMTLDPASMNWLDQDVHVIWEKGPLYIHLTDARAAV